MPTTTPTTTTVTATTTTYTVTVTTSTSTQTSTTVSTVTTNTSTTITTTASSTTVTVQAHPWDSGKGFEVGPGTARPDLDFRPGYVAAGHGAAEGHASLCLVRVGHRFQCGRADKNTSVTFVLCDADEGCADRRANFTADLSDETFVDG